MSKLEAITKSETKEQWSSGKIGSRKRDIIDYLADFNGQPILNDDETELVEIAVLEDDYRDKTSEDFKQFRTIVNNQIECDCMKKSEVMGNRSLVITKDKLGEVDNTRLKTELEDIFTQYSNELGLNNESDESEETDESDESDETDESDE